MTTSLNPRRLSTAECWALLETVRVGRLALTDGDGAPDIFPVNFVTHEGAVYIRSAPDVKVVRLAAHPAAAFEVDGHSDDAWWSVVLRGTAARIQDELEIERSGAARLVTASPRYKQHVIKLTAHTVSGRRFADSAAHGPLASPTPSHPEGELDARPFTIPSRRPWSDGVSLEGSR